MENTRRICVIKTALGCLVLGALLPSAGEAGRARAMLRCDELFLSAPEKKLTVAPTVSASRGHEITPLRARLPVAAVVPRLNGDLTEMRFQLNQGGGPAALIPISHLPETFRLHGVAGDPVFPDANGDYVSIQLSNVPTNRANFNTANDLTQLGAVPAKLKLTSTQLDRALEQLLRRRSPKMIVAPEFWSMLVQAARENPPDVKEAIEAYESGALALEGPPGSLKLSAPNAPTTRANLATAFRSDSSALAIVGTNAHSNELSNAGASRYFRFFPEGETQEVSARVLDIHVHHVGGAHVYAEWISRKSNGTRIRNVGMVSLEELKTVAKLSAADRLSSATDFFDSVTPNQLAIQMMAQQLNVEPFGYTDFMRAPGMTSQRASLITEKMGNLGHFSVRAETEAIFGSLDHLLTPFERSKPGLWNAIDVFGRLVPDFVLKKFGTGHGFKYMFVINEDGALRVSPLGSAIANLRPQLLRLGHGRKIFSAGTFTIDERGHVQITRRTADYTSWDGAMFSGARENESENHLIRAAFFMQGAVETASINDAAPDLWHQMRYDAETGMHERVNKANGSDRDSSARQGHSSPGQKGPFENYKSKEARAYIEELLRARTASETAVPDWGRETTNSKPPTFEEWANQAGRTSETQRGLDAQAKLAYSHYVLGTNANQTFAEIRKAYRNLQAKFYSRDGNGNSDAAQRINDAFKIFKDQAQP